MSVFARLAVRRGRTAASFGSALIAAALLASCSSGPSSRQAGGSDSGPAPSTGAINPSGGLACSMATAADVGSAFGEQFEAGQPSSPGGQSACLFRQTGGGVDLVTVLVVAGSQADTFYASNKAAYAGTDVSGLGDKAFVSKDGGQLGVQRGSLTLLIHLVGFTGVAPASLQAKQQALARVALPRAA